MPNTPLTYVEVDLKAVAHNLKEIRRLAVKNKLIAPSRFPWSKERARKMDILAVIKADAYGHGMVKIGQLLQKWGIHYFGVSDVSEGILLRKSGITKNILIFESTLASHVQEIVRFRLIPTICTLELARALNHYAKKIKRTIPVHIKVDTGMSRLGVWHEEAFEFIKIINELEYISIRGIYTHFPAADTDQKFTKTQMGQLFDLVMRLDKAGIVIPAIHAANSMGLAGYKTDILNLARPGLMIYGLYPDPSLKNQIRLKPVLSVKSQVIFLKRIAKGRSVSYGRTFFALKDMTIATIPIGYSDGYFRIFSNRSEVLIDGRRCPVIGRVTMDQIVVDVSKVKGVKIGMPVVILGAQGKERISADELARHAATIHYEIVCSLGNLLPRVYR